jgi:hypothetical protein
MPLETIHLKGKRYIYLTKLHFKNIYSILKSSSLTYFYMQVNDVSLGTMNHCI